MSSQDFDSRGALGHVSIEPQPIVTSGPWLRAGLVALSVEALALILRAGLVALSVEALALIMLAIGAASPELAIAIAIVAGVYARWAWHRARAALNADKAGAR
jgi:hypothetical protein